MRFTIEPRRWYANEFISGFFGPEIPSLSPIFVYEAEGKKTNQRALELSFYHANYPEGVRDKVYELETIERNSHFYLGRSTRHDPKRYLLITQITREWVASNFEAVFPREQDIEDWLTHNA